MYFFSWIPQKNLIRTLFQKNQYQKHLYTFIKSSGQRNIFYVCFQILKLIQIARTLLKVKTVNRSRLLCQRCPPVHLQGFFCENISCANTICAFVHLIIICAKTTIAYLFIICAKTTFVHLLIFYALTNLKFPIQRSIHLKLQGKSAWKR